MDAPYADIKFADPPPDRPYVFINMVATIDGKILSGERDEHVMDLGSEVDHAAMRNLERAADAVLIGAGSLRATPGLWYPRELKRIVMTRSLDVFHQNGAVRRFFSDCPDQAFVATDTPGDLPPRVRRLPLAQGLLLEMLRQDHGIERLLIEGGSEINALFLGQDLVDEVFLTIAPKVKLGRDIPTIAGGEPLGRAELLSFTLISAQQSDSELFLRYRRL